MRAGAGRRWRGTAAVLASMVLVGACSSDGGREGSQQQSRPEPTVPSGSSDSSPFAVRMPEGYELVTAGVGRQRQTWGEDCCGTDEPYTVLERSEGDGGPVRVSIAGYEDTQGGFFQTMNGYGHSDGDVDGEFFEIDGKRAAWYPGAPAGGADLEGDGRWDWAELGVDEGRDVAVSISGSDLGRKDAEVVYEAVEVDGAHTEPPQVPAPPDGYAVAGSVDAHGTIALASAFEPRADWVPGTAEVHSAAWAEGSRSLTVQAVPGRSLALEAAALVEDGGELRSIDGGPVLVIDRGEGFSSRRITVGIDAPWGDVVLVTALTDQARSKNPVTLPSVEELVAIARSVEQATPAQWDALVASVPR
ncbi:hypothetical protein ACE2AJ_17245 [Aquihabitans daechungensis]|uniref:hypothetical protein n=1 Tax=Aquihabitans daechungensis TaxID=1052257 RepID=UPI003B9E0484